MCCITTIFLVLASRIAIFLWWLVDQPLFVSAFKNWTLPGNLTFPWRPFSAVDNPGVSLSLSRGHSRLRMACSRVRPIGRPGRSRRRLPSPHPHLTLSKAPADLIKAVHDRITNTLRPVNLRLPGSIMLSRHAYALRL
jgi:hypothetical protein